MYRTKFADESETSPKSAKGYKKMGMERFTAKWYDKDCARKRLEQYKTAGKNGGRERSGGQ